jgi:hypothetical protein
MAGSGAAVLSWMSLPFLRPWVLSGGALCPGPLFHLHSCTLCWGVHVGFVLVGEALLASLWLWAGLVVLRFAFVALIVVLVIDRIVYL